MKLLFLGAAFAVITLSTGVESRKRSRTTSSTTEAAPVVDLEQTLADREASLLDREESFRTREAVFRMREESLSLREEQFKVREDKLSMREKNIALREQNTLRGSCSNAEGSAPPPDYAVVRMDTDTGKLIDIGDLGTCSDNMRFFANPENETVGQCDCDYHQCARPLIYSDKYKQCFWAWSQGPCEQKEWFTYDENHLPICEANPCPETVGLATPSYYFKSPEDSKCYKAGSKGPCTKKGERLFTIPDDPIPRCRAQSLCAAQSIPAVQRCLPGNRRFLDGFCTDEANTSDDTAEGE